MKKPFQLKHAHTLFLAILLSMTSAIFTACSDDDNGPKGSDDFLVGTWKYQFDYAGYVYYTFNADGTGNITEYDDGQIDQQAKISYTHYPNESKIKVIIFENGVIDEILTVEYDKISDSRLIVYDFSDETELWEKQ